MENKHAGVARKEAQNLMLDRYLSENRREAPFAERLLALYQADEELTKISDG